VWFARRRWGEAAGWLSGLAYATMVLPLAYARTAIFDSTLTLCTTAAIVWFADERPVAAWAALAVGALTKGPIAIAIPLLTLVSHAAATGAPVRRLFPWRGLALFGAIALPWFVAVSIEHPNFPGYVFLRETLERVTTRSFHRTAPFWYYLPIVPLAAFPWIVPALARVKNFRATWDARRDAAVSEPLLLVCWVVVPLVFLSLNQSKLPQYVLPLIPALALAAALDRSGGTGTVLGVLAYPPSLPFYLGRPIAVATETGRELTSNYIADNVERFRSIPGSPLLPAGYWREALARCPMPTVFLTGAGHREARTALLAALPLLAADDHYAA